MPTQDTFCSYCGTAYVPPLAYPRTCATCKTTVWSNPIPVSVVLVPVERDGRTGLLVVRRDIEPKRGLLALVGEQGVMDLIGASGYYTLVSMTLNVARVPLPAGEKIPLK